MKKEKPKKRFNVSFSENPSFSSTAEIVVDNETGVNYLVYYSAGTAGGITPLIDRDGKPIISSIATDFDM